MKKQFETLSDIMPWVVMAGLLIGLWVFFGQLDRMSSKQPTPEPISENLQDSLNRAAMEADKKASLERFRQDKKAKAEWEAGKNGNK